MLYVIQTFWPSRHFVLNVIDFIWPVVQTLLPRHSICLHCINGSKYLWPNASTWQKGSVYPARTDIDLGEFVIVNTSVCTGKTYIFMLCSWASLIELWCWISMEAFREARWLHIIQSSKSMKVLNGILFLLFSWIKLSCDFWFSRKLFCYGRVL